VLVTSARVALGDGDRAQHQGGRLAAHQPVGIVQRQIGRGPDAARGRPDEHGEARLGRGGAVGTPPFEPGAIGAPDGAIDDLRHGQVTHQVVRVRIGRQRRQEGERARLGLARRFVLQVVDDQRVGCKSAHAFLLRGDDLHDALGQRARLRRRQAVEAQVGTWGGEAVQERAHGTDVTAFRAVSSVLCDCRSLTARIGDQLGVLVGFEIWFRSGRRLEFTRWDR
jgi:hypothetical protein